MVAARRSVLNGAEESRYRGRRDRQTKQMVGVQRAGRLSVRRVPFGLLLIIPLPPPPPPVISMRQRLSGFSGLSNIRKIRDSLGEQGYG